MTNSVIIRMYIVHQVSVLLFFLMKFREKINYIVFLVQLFARTFTVKSARWIQPSSLQIGHLFPLDYCATHIYLPMVFICRKWAA